MTDTTTGDTGNGQTGQQTDTGTLDLRPPQDSILYDMLRLGLAFDHSDDGTSQTWIDYSKNLRADFTSLDADHVTFTDMDSRLARDIPRDQLHTITGITTWRSGQPQQDATE